ncbi:hypothetical protein J2S89_003435, partial [Arthrobacter bambusae]|nr:hypothetical protein [Arthrobacter bambusae]MDQ0099804.1 hypothetical protein [Arthrobacter bambusae]
ASTDPMYNSFVDRRGHPPAEAFAKQYSRTGKKAIVDAGKEMFRGVDTPTLRLHWPGAWQQSPRCFECRPGGAPFRVVRFPVDGFPDQRRLSRPGRVKVGPVQSQDSAIICGALPLPPGGGQESLIAFQAHKSAPLEPNVETSVGCTTSTETSHSSPTGIPGGGPVGRRGGLPSSVCVQAGSPARW